MKKVALLITILVLMAVPSVFAGDNFHKGFHERLGHHVADAAVNLTVRLLTGDLNGDGCTGCRPERYARGGPRIGHIPPPRLLPPTGNARRWARSPRDQAYYRAKDRIHWQEYRRWERREREIGRAQGELDAYSNIQRNRCRFFTRY